MHKSKRRLSVSPLDAISFISSYLDRSSSETDHKPLLSISSKGIGDMPPLLQRFFYRLLKFDYTLQYVPGKQLVLAYMLSRSAPAHGNDKTGATEDVEIHAVELLGYLVTRMTQEKLATETARDDNLRSVITSLSSGESVSGELKPFASELTVVRGILLKGTKVVVPKSMRQEILARIHAGHLGLQKCKERAMCLVFWPGLNSAINRVVRTCAVCKKYAYKQPKEPLIMRPVPECAWYRVGVDIFCYGGHSYLIAYDSFSNFPEVEKLSDTSSTTTISALSAIFSRYGIPVEVCTDNGPQFSSYEFAKFAKRYDFTYITSSPGYPQSNGLAEKGVQVVKRILKKSADAGEDFWLGLLAYRSAPLEDSRSPGELLQGRRLRGNLPDFGDFTTTEVKKHRQTYQGRQLSDLSKGDVVRLADRTWSTKAQVLDSAAPRSFNVRTEDRRVLRWNRRHLLATAEQYTPDTDDDDCELSSPSWNPVATSASDHPSAAPSGLLVPTDATPRRSARAVQRPQRLHYVAGFNQVT